MSRAGSGPRTRGRIAVTAFRGLELSGAGGSGRFELSGQTGTRDSGVSALETADLCHAEELVNFICRDGILRKRSGWREILRVPAPAADSAGNSAADSAGDSAADSAGDDATTAASVAVNGIFPFREGDTEVTILHAGRRFYRLAPDGTLTDITEKSTYLPAAVDPARLTDTRSAAFLRGGRLYLVGCGDYLCYGRFQERAGFELRRVQGDSETYLPTTHRAAGPIGSGEPGKIGDPPNTLSFFRKNTFTGTAENAGFLLDARPDLSGEVTIRLTIAGTDGTPVTKVYRNTGADRTVFVNNAGEAAGEIFETEGKILLRIPSAPPVAGGTENIEITFPVTLDAPVCRCAFGTIYGEGGGADRLFLSGDPSACNRDYYSAAGDYTYFPPGAVNTVGSDAAAILGYARAADGRLLLYKAESPFESTVFIRDGTRSADGGFPAAASGLSRGALSRFSLGQLGDEPLFLSSDGVCSLTLGANGPVVRPRSRPVAARLREESAMEEAVAIVYNGRYYLSFSDHTYVADGGYRRKYADGAVSFEWFYFDHTPVRVFGTYGGKLAFGTGDGRLCVFDGEAFCDRTYEESRAGQLLVSVTDNRVLRAENAAFAPSEGDKVTFLTKGLYALLLKDAVLSSGRVAVTPARIFTFHEGMTVYADRVGESGLSVNTPYTVREIDPGACTFALYSGQTRVPLSSGGFALCRALSGQTLYAAGADGSGFSLRADRAGEVLTLFAYAGATPAAPVAVFAHEVPVAARFVTPAFTPGGHDAVKKLLSMTVTAVPESGGSLSFGFETRRSRREQPVRGAGRFSFGACDFTDFSFDTGFENSFTVRAGARNFNYIRFLFTSAGDTDCALCRFTADYQILRKSKGVM